MNYSLPVIKEKKCKGCEIIMTKSMYKSYSDFRRRTFHNMDCRRAWDKKNGGYGRGNLL